MEEITMSNPYQPDHFSVGRASGFESEVIPKYPSISTIINEKGLFRDSLEAMATFMPTKTYEPLPKKFTCASVGATNDPVIDHGNTHSFNASRIPGELTNLDDEVKGSRNKRIINQTPSSFVPLTNYGYEPRLPGPLLKLNISGTRFLIKMETLRKDPMVYLKILEDAEWLADTEEYYFERDPVVFRFVHSYLRYQELHLPLNICGPLLEKELEAWGLQLGFDLQRCCLGPAMESKSKLESLKKFEDVFTDSTSVINSDCQKHEKWQTVREEVWRVIGDTPKKRWLNQTNISPTVSSPIQDDDDTVCNTANASINQMLIHSNIIMDETKTQSYSNGDAGQREETAVTENGIGVKPTSNHNTNTPFNWRHLQNTPHQIICSRVYVAIQAIVICSLILLMILTYVPSLRVTFGPTVNLSATNGSLPTDSFHVYRMYFAFDAVEQRLTCPFISISVLTWICVLLFTLDLFTRAIFCPKIWKWLRSIYTITDILSLIPFYVEGIMYITIAQFPNTPEKSTQMLKILRVLDIVNLLKICVAGRLFRILQRQRATRVLIYTVRTSASNMLMIIELMTLCAVFFGTAIFFLDARFESILQGMWWALITMATVGYGDVVPSSLAGYSVTVVCVLAGILLTSYTVPILVNDFLLYYGHADKLAWMRRIHKSATAKRETDRYNLISKSRFSRVRAIIKNNVIGNLSVTRNSNTIRSAST